MGKAVVPSSIVFEVLGKDNYEDWSETIRDYLEFKDLWDVVESNEQPPDRDADEAMFKAWKQKNCEALHAIKISCGRNFLSKIREIREANKAWRTLESYFDPPLPRRIEYTINPQQGDEENVDDEYKKAYISLADAFSRRHTSNAIELCENNPSLLKELLPNCTPVLHGMIMLGCDLFMEYEVLEMLKWDHFPKEALQMRDSLGRTPLIAAVTVGAVGIAKTLHDMSPALIGIPDHFGNIPLAVAIESGRNDMFVGMLYYHTPRSVFTLNEGKYGATVITKCFEARELDFALTFLNDHPHLIFAKDVNGISPLFAAARAPYMFSTRTYNHKFPKFISNFLRLWLPHSMDIEISRIELLFAMRNAIRGQNMGSGLLRDAFFEAIKCGNFVFIVMLINADKTILEEVNDMSKNIYMCAIEYRRAKVFSLIFWDKNHSKDRAQYANVWQDRSKNNLLHMAATWTPPNALDRSSRPTMLMISEAMWFEQVSEMAPHLLTKPNADGMTPYELYNESHRDLLMEAEKWMKESAAPWAFIGPLVITIMFAAAFQIPGGYNQEKGFPIFLNNKLFKVYMVLVSTSFFTATISALKFLDILYSNYEGKDFLSSLRTYNVISGTLFLSLATMLVAFCLGLFLTLRGELAIFLPIAVITTFLVGYIVYKKFHVFVGSSTIYKRKTSLFEKNIGDEVEVIFEMLDRQPTMEEAT